jgi:hypothetical protein
LDKNIIIISAILLVVVFVTFFTLTSDDGITDKPENDDCITLSARELYEKMYFNITDENPNENQQDVSLNKTIITKIYDSLSNGDCIIIRDNISIITYNEEEDKTTITFSWYEDPYTKPHEYYYFTGNITDIYQKDDEIEIRLTLLHKELETNNEKYIIDVFEEQWVSDEYFINNVESILFNTGLKNMNPSIITKI